VLQKYTQEKTRWLAKAGEKAQRPRGPSLTNNCYRVSLRAAVPLQRIFSEFTISKEGSMKLVGIVLTTTLLLGTAACHSTRVQIPTAPIGPNEKSLGPTWGDDVGLLLLGVIPIQQNERFVAAYNEAVQKAGATRLTDVTISERWWWGMVIHGKVFKVEGTAVTNK
jgi:hypothetical protein